MKKKNILYLYEREALELFSISIKLLKRIGKDKSFLETKLDQIYEYGD
jgi:hypothetical protein